MKKTVLIAALALLGTMSAMAEKQTLILHVAEIECDGCIKKVEKALAFEKGIKKLNCDLESKNVTVVYEDKHTEVATLQKALKKYAGFDSEIYTGENKPSTSNNTCAGASSCTKQ